MYHYLPKLAIGPVSKLQRFFILLPKIIHRLPEPSFHSVRLSFFGGRPFRFGAITRRVELSRIVEFKIEFNTT